MTRTKNTNPGPNPSGLCLCGCGQRTHLAPYTSCRMGWVKDRPISFIIGHHRRMSPLEYIVDSETGCWIWQRAISPNPSFPYGRAAINQRKVHAHRMMYERIIGPIPEGMFLDHLCRNPSCVNPAHLEPVSQAVNCQRGKNTKLTPSDVREIRRLAPTTKHRDLARRFGITKAHVSDVVTKKVWKNI